MPISFHKTEMAVRNAIVGKNFEEIDHIIATDINALALVRHSRTPIFSVVEEMLAATENKDCVTRAHTVNLIVEGLRKIFTRMDAKFGSDKAVLMPMINASCNHISHTAMLESGGTLRDILERYTGTDLARRPNDRDFHELYYLAQEFGLVTCRGVVTEKIRVNALSANTEVRGR